MGIGKGAVPLLGDTESSLKLATNLVIHQRSKHIRTEYHSLCDCVVENAIQMCKIDTRLNAANTLTKHVEVGVLKTCKGLVGMTKCG